jgi:membrane associated rhomboid family serine protease
MKVEIKRTILEFLSKLKNPILLTLLIFLSWISAFIISVIAKLIFGDLSDNIMNYNPFLNGFIHADWSHLICNLSLIFIFLVPTINQQYTFTKVYFITLFISLTYFPISILTSLPAVGISGTLHFMLSRVCLNKFNIPLYIFFAIIIFPEIINIFNTSDGTAHTVHIIGSVLGFISLHLKNTNLNKYKLVQIIS